MREIKFRCFNEENGEMIYGLQNIIYLFDWYMYNLNDIHELNLMQWTGSCDFKKDEFGQTIINDMNEIYEDDILEVELYNENKYEDFNNRYVVKYYPTHCHYSGMPILNEDAPSISMVVMNGSNVKRCEVIGNIYQDSHLLEEEK